MTPLEAMAKAVAKELWHHDEDRPFTDEAWEREMKWLYQARNEPDFIKGNLYASKCFRIARASLIALSEAGIGINHIASGAHWAADDMKTLPQDMRTAYVEASFRAICRSIAEAADA